MKPKTHPRRGGVLKALLLLFLLLAAAAVVIYLIATRGAEMQDKLRDKGEELRDKVSGALDKGPAGSQREPAARPEAPAGTPAAREPARPAPEANPRPVYTVKRPPPVQKTWHTVAKGETLFSIAETYYEDGTLWKLIAEANGLKDTSGLKEGMLISIPGR